MAIKTTHARIACERCGTWIYTERCGTRPAAFPSRCRVCGAPTPKETT